MEQQISEFIEGIQTPVKKLGIKELRSREQTWRALWSWIDDEIKYYIIRVGTVVRIVKRDYKGTVGVLGAVKFSISQIELTVKEKSYNYNDGKYYYEDKVVLIPSGSIMIQEFISSSQLASEVEKLEVMGLEEDTSLEEGTAILNLP